MVETWQVVAAGIPIFLTAASVLGKVVWDNKQDVSRLSQRLLGHPGDDTDDGFISDTNRQLEELDNKVETHAEVTHTQLRHVDQKVDTLVSVVVDNNEDIDGDEIPTDAHVRASDDFYRGGSSSESGGDD